MVRYSEVVTTTAVLATEQGSKAVEAGTRQTEVAGESIQALTAKLKASGDALAVSVSTNKPK